MSTNQEVAIALAAGALASDELTFGEWLTPSDFTVIDDERKRWVVRIRLGDDWS